MGATFKKNCNFVYILTFMKELLISVIVPVYGVERFLGECLDSILAQSHRELQVILVDDGSADSSPEICDKYALSDSRVKVIHQPNGGVSRARNVGISHATGEYILFVDADDTLGNSEGIAHAAKILSQNPKIDVLSFELTYITTKRAYEHPPLDVDRLNSLSKDEALKHLISIDRLDSAACSKFIRRQIVVDNDIKFIPDIRSEDYDWTLNILLHSETIRFTSDHFYHYRQWEGSASATISTKHLWDIWHTIKLWCDKRPESGLYLDYIAYIYGFLMSRLYLIPEKKQRQELLSQMKSYSHLLKYRGSKKMRWVAMLYNICGFSLACNILGLMVRLRETERD